MMLADIRRQPEVLQRLLDREAEFRQVASEWLQPGTGGQVVAVGCGDGWFASRSQSPHSAASLEFLSEKVDRITSKDRVLAISMSGNVDRTVEAATAARDRGATVVALVNGNGGRLAAVASSAISLDIPDLAPFLCGTSSYTATLLALQLLFGPEHCRGVAQTMSTLLDSANQFAQDLVDANAALDGVRFLSCGRMLATADYGAAKLVEVTHVPSWSDDIEEFAHRQYWTTSFRNTVLYVVREQASAECAGHSVEALTGAGVVTGAVDRSCAMVSQARHRFTLPDCPDAQVPILAAVPLQLFAYHLAESTGLNPNTRLHLKNDTLRFNVSRRLTRRSLLGTGQ